MTKRFKTEYTKSTRILLRTLKKNNYSVSMQFMPNFEETSPLKNESITKQAKELRLFKPIPTHLHINTDIYRYVP